MRTKCVLTRISVFGILVRMSTQMQEHLSSLPQGRKRLTPLTDGNFVCEACGSIVHGAFREAHIHWHTFCEAQRVSEDVRHDKSI